VKLVAGLGNPGNRYTETRHNIGFMVAARLAADHGVTIKKSGHQGLYGVGRVADEEATILLPQTFMNLSGVSVGSACRSFAITPKDLIVIHDDIDLPFGSLRIKAGGGHGGHNGIRSVREVLGTGDFIRVKVGVGRPVEGDVAGYVLRPFSADERKKLDTVISNAAAAVEFLVSQGVQKAMNEYNNRDIANS